MSELWAAELVAVVREHPLQAPAGALQLAGNAEGELACLSCGGIALLADHQLSPGVGGAHVDRGELPDRAVGSFQPTHVETVDSDQLAGPTDVNVLLRPWVSGRLIGRGVPGDQPEAL